LIRGAFPIGAELSFGTSLHEDLEDLLNGWEPLPGVTVEAEGVVFDNEDSNSINRADHKRLKSSIGIDLLASYDEPILGLDLKTGRGASNSRNSKLSKRLGELGIAEIHIDWLSGD